MTNAIQRTSILLPLTLIAMLIASSLRASGGNTAPDSGIGLAIINPDFCIQEFKKSSASATCRYETAAIHAGDQCEIRAQCRYWDEDDRHWDWHPTQTTVDSDRVKDLQNCNGDFSFQC